MKAVSSSPYSSLASQALKLVGAILILSFLIDFVILLFPSGPQDLQWQIELATAIVDRAVIPMIGIALILVGYWIDATAGSAASNRQIWQDLRFWVLLLSCILGFIFLILFPVHINNVRQDSAQKIEDINEKAKQAQTQLQAEASQLQAQLGDKQVQAELEKRKEQFRTEVNELLKDEQRFNQAIQSNQLPAERKKLLQQFKANPKSLDEYMAQQSDPQALTQQRLNQIQGDRERLAQQTSQEAWRSGLRTGISSLLLAVGYIIIGWTGLRSIGSLSRSSQKTAGR